MNGGLNPNQVRAVVAAFAHVEQALSTTEDILAGPHHNLFRQVRIAEGEQQRQEVEQACNAARALLREAMATFDLPGREDDGARIARAECSVAWAGVEGVRTKRLGAYGDVDPTLSDTLDPFVDRLAALLLHIAALFDQWPPIK